MSTIMRAAGIIILLATIALFVRAYGWWFFKKPEEPVQKLEEANEEVKKDDPPQV